MQADLHYPLIPELALGAQTLPARAAPILYCAQPVMMVIKLLMESVICLPVILGASDRRDSLGVILVI